MLSSIILSMVMSSAPALASDTQQLDSQEIIRSRKAVRINSTFETKEIIRSRKSVRINSTFETKEIIRSRKSVRI